MSNSCPDISIHFVFFPIHYYHPVGLLDVIFLFLPNFCSFIVYFVIGRYASFLNSAHLPTHTNIPVHKNVCTNKSINTGLLMLHLFCVLSSAECLVSSLVCLSEFGKIWPAICR
ncbi:hypothetical protein AHF37_11067 [Paragonimus kellicotti]|nr:hypothetical protein AHF37_11067 [Paragonimus kellicotti]